MRGGGKGASGGYIIIYLYREGAEKRRRDVLGADLADFTETYKLINS